MNLNLPSLFTSTSPFPFKLQAFMFVFIFFQSSNLTWGQAFESTHSYLYIALSLMIILIRKSKIRLVEPFHPIFKFNKTQD